MAATDKEKLEAALQAGLRAADVPAFELVHPDGTTARFGHDPGAAPAFRLVIRRPEAAAVLASLDEYAIALAYTDGAIDIEGDFPAALDLRRHLSDRHPLAQLQRFLRPALLGQDRHDNRATPKHYDLPPEFYYRFLDRDHRLYSQALYRSENDSLEQAARAKLEFIWDACRLQPGSRVLDIGAGWGSFSRFAVARGAQVTMLTLSRVQLAVLEELARTPEHQGRMKVRLENLYRFDEERGFDAVVLLGVMEHIPQYLRFFRRMAGFLRPGGRLYLDFAAVRRKYDIPTFTYRHVFEGNHTPVHMPGLIAAANRTPLELVSVHNDRHSYYLTLRAWARNLEAVEAEVCRDFGQSAYRLFHLYLWTTAHALGQTGGLESFRVVLQRAQWLPSAVVGL